MLGHDGVKKLGQLGTETLDKSGIDIDGILGIDTPQLVNNGKMSTIKVSLFMIR